VIPLATRAPFHLEATVRVLQRRATNVVDVWDDGRYLRLFELSGGLTLVAVRDHGKITRPRLRLTIEAGQDSTAAYAEARTLLRRTLSLDVDPVPLQRRAESQAASRATCRALRGMRPPRFATLFEAFASVIPFQQLSLDAGTAIVARLVARFGQKLVHENRPFHAFPTARRIAHARLASLHACGLSRSKSLTLRDIAREIEAGELDEARLARSSTDEALARLMELPGIGPWSGGLVLLRGLGRLDVFPPGDVGAARNLRALMRLDPGEPLAPVIERCGNQRGYLYFCALGAALLRNGLIHPAP
jgi:DNA-3-methyladenine glycosylase II